MQITNELIQAVLVCRHLALKTAGDEIFKQATIIEKFKEDFIAEMKKDNSKEDFIAEMKKDNSKETIEAKGTE